MAENINSEPSIESIDWATVGRLSCAVAKRVSQEYPGIEADDISQAINLHVAENWYTYLKAEYPEGQLRKNFKQIGTAYAGKERYTYIFHSAEYVYTNAEVRQLFERAFFQPELWEQVPVKETGVSISSGNVVVALWDINEAFNNLSPDDQAIIVSKYEKEEDLDGTGRKALTRAIDKVVRALNGAVLRKQIEAKQYSGPGLRRCG